MEVIYILDNIPHEEKISINFFYDFATSSKIKFN